MLWNNRAAQSFSTLRRMFALICTNISVTSVSFLDLSLASQMHQCEEGCLYVLYYLNCCEHATLEHPIYFCLFFGNRRCICFVPCFNADIMMSQSMAPGNRHLSLSLLYKHSESWGFFHALNSGAFAVLSVGPKFAGLAKATEIKEVPKGATYVYGLSWLVGAIVAFLIFTIADMVWPMDNKF